MCQSFDNPSLLHQYDDEMYDDIKTRDDNNYYCNKCHLMTSMKINDNDGDNDNKEEKQKCLVCNEFLNYNSFDYSCILCDEYICHDCNIVKQLMKMLKNEQFKQFDKQVEHFQQQSKIIKSVEFTLFCLLYMIHSFGKHDACRKKKKKISIDKKTVGTFLV